MYPNRLLKIIVIGAVICLVFGAGILIYLRWNIQSSLDQFCVMAQEAYPHHGDHISSLIDFVESDSHSLRKRNLCVWALGQARDNRALPVLQKYFTGNKCNHDHNLCQSELGKAIKLCKGQTPNLLRIKLH
jgi:hypothetical protein